MMLVKSWWGSYYQINAPRILDVICMGFIMFHVYNIAKDVHSLNDAIVNHKICHVVGNPEDAIKLAGRCK